MKTLNRLLSWILIAVLLFGNLSFVATPVSAADEDVIALERSSVPAAALPESEELFQGYLEQLFYPGSSVSFFGAAAKDQLSARGQSLYTFLKDNLASVASGTASSTVFRLSTEQISAWGGSISYEKSTSQTGQEAANAAFDRFMTEFEVDNVIYALLHDCPYELYWYDKVSGVKEGASFTLQGNICTIKQVDFKFAVVADLRASGYSDESPVFDTANAAAAAAAAKNARDIVGQYAELSDYAKLLAYKDKICSLVAYDKAAATNGNFSADADPWQLIHVFDGNDTTNVVCEGYSKAFQYLFDLSDMVGDVDCITASGNMSGEGHMWNIVSVNGQNYLTDITNSDAGTIGSNGELFMTGASGDISSGFTAQEKKYTYNSKTLTLWGTAADSKLNIAANRYQVCTSHTEVTDPAEEATCTKTGLSAGSHCSECGEVIVEQTVIPSKGHSMGQWQTTEDATCTVDGSQRRDCSRCDHYETKTITAPGHKYASVVTAPTCTADGYTTHTCSKCSHSYTDTPVGKLGHNMGNWSTTKDATCTADGSQRRDCDRCDHYEAKTITAPGHKYASVVTAPTCTADGYTTHTCSKCSHSYTDTPVGKLGHNMGSWSTTKDATCTADGSQRRDCSRCDHYETNTISATGHKYASVVTAPTCTADGYTTHTCSKCGSSYTDTPVTKLGHKWKNATCTAPKTCDLCTKTTGKALGHSYTDEWDDTCNTCGHVREIDIACSPMYRLYNPYTQEHLLTASATERDLLVSAGWHLDGTAWNSPDSGDPVYRLYNPYDDWHTYSMNQEEIDMLVGLGWKVDGVVCRSAVQKYGKPVYRLFNPYEQKNYHLLTASEEERAFLESLGWRLDGIAWLCMK